MPEGSKDAALLIGISYQARQRQLVFPNPNTQRADCTVVIVFAVFYLEATIDVIVEQMNLKKKMDSFLNPNHSNYYQPGLQDKLGWFYNEFIARDKAKTKSQLYKKGIARKLRRKFPGFAKLYKFRNDVSHGVIGRPAVSLKDTQDLRDQAQAIRDLLYQVAQKHDPSVVPDTFYWEAT